MQVDSSTYSKTYSKLDFNIICPVIIVGSFSREDNENGVSTVDVIPSIKVINIR